MMRLFGRLHSPDERDGKYPVLMRAATPRMFRYWNDTGAFYDQLQTPQCVAYAWAHWLEDGPITYDGLRFSAEAIRDLYWEAQQRDEWPGSNYEGTSVRGGAKALLDRKLITEYRWAFTIEQVVSCLLHDGPMVVGTNWYSGMFQADSEDILHIRGGVSGGHAYCLNGINLKRGLIRIKNSWGTTWAGDGRAMISIEDFERLLREDGEACLAKESP